MSCKHVEDAEFMLQLKPPRPSQQIHKEECTQCFDSQDGPNADGICICLHCFNAGCPDQSGPERSHASKHFRYTRHPLALQLRRTEKPAPRENASEEPPHKLHKLAIEEENEADKYDYHMSVRCLECQVNDLDKRKGQIPLVIDGILSSMSFARQSEVKAWSEEITFCAHVENLRQEGKKHLEASGLASCNHPGCELRENLWLCLICGNLGCGRQQYGGIGGNSHGLEHYETSDHAVSVKLGTITPEGQASIFCYACQEDRLDPSLSEHLKTFGIDVSTQTKTEKTITELQIEQNLRFDFNMTGQDGKELKPAFGAGLTGIKNLGNSCYMASVLQTLFSLDPFAQRYTRDFERHADTCQYARGNTPGGAASCLDCQMNKIADGLLSGRYGDKLVDQTGNAYQKGIRPDMFKALVGKSHEEFATMRQQDADEFIRHLLKVIEQDERRNGSTQDPTKSLQFVSEERIQCTSCGKVRYRKENGSVLSVPVKAKQVLKENLMDGQASVADKVEYEPVALSSCFDALAAPEIVEYNCGSCRRKTSLQKTTKFWTFPRILVVHARRFELVGWVPRKVQVPIKVDGESLLLDPYKSYGKMDDEILLPEDDVKSSSPGLPDFNAEVMANLTSMGFPEARVQKAMLATGNTSDATLAMDWLFAHMDDPDIDLPIKSASADAASSAKEPSPENVAMLGSMGFTDTQAKAALVQTNGDVERAVDWLFSHPNAPDATLEGASNDAYGSSEAASAGDGTMPASYRLKAFISHNGPSVHSGHYVAHVRKNVSGVDHWIFFNDEKVVFADGIQALMEQAYVYVFERHDYSGERSSTKSHLLSDDGHWNGFKRGEMPTLSNQ